MAIYKKFRKEIEKEKKNMNFFNIQQRLLDDIKSLSSLSEENCAWVYICFQILSFVYSLSQLKYTNVNLQRAQEVPQQVLRDLLWSTQVKRDQFTTHQPLLTPPRTDQGLLPHRALIPPALLILHHQRLCKSLERLNSPFVKEKAPSGTKFLCWVISYFKFDIWSTGGIITLDHIF